jgi:hypothetical protein
MKKLYMSIEIGGLLHSLYCLEDGQVKELCRIPVDNIPETIAFYANEKNIEDVILIGGTEYLQRIKDNILTKHEKLYGKSILNVEIKEKI